MKEKKPASAEILGYQPGNRLRDSENSLQDLATCALPLEPLYRILRTYSETVHGLIKLNKKSVRS